MEVINFFVDFMYDDTVHLYIHGQFRNMAKKVIVLDLQFFIF